MVRQEIQLNYGAERLEFQVPQANLVGIFRPQPVAACADPLAALAAALRGPLDTPPLAQLVRPHERIAILVDDHTRTTPAAQILPVVLGELQRAGVQDEDVTIVITHGTHRLSSEDEVRHKVGEEVYGRFRIVQHDCQDEENQVYVGLTSRGTPVWLNRFVVEADRRIGIGHIGPSPYAGYSGGSKLLIPGVAALDTINANHTLVALGVGQPGVVEVPCRLDIQEGAAFVGLDLVLDVVLNQDEGIVAALAGTPDEVYRRGVALARRVYEVRCPGAIDIAVTSGYPYELDLYQAERAVEYADVVVRKGGSILLVAPCPDGIGGEEFFRLMADHTKKPDDYLRDVVRRNGKVTFSILGYLVARIKAEKKIYMLTDGISSTDLEAMGFRPVRSLQEGVDALLAEYGPGARVAVFPMGSSTIPSVEQQ